MLPLRTKIEKRGISQSELLNRISSYLVQGQEEAGKRKRPVVTVTYAQSLDGSISLVSSAPLKLSNGPSLKFTHHLRILHDAILIGIGTLIADNPRLTARLIQGKNPRPVVVDSHLRFPLEARLIRTNRMKPWIAATRRIDQLKEESLDALGGKVIKLPSMENGWVNLTALLEDLYKRGIRSVMVEGGARIISSFLRENLADLVIITIVPVILGGFRGIYALESVKSPFITSFNDILYDYFEDNLIVCGFTRNS